MEANHVALKRHPVAHRALVFGLTGLGVLGADKLGGAVVAVDLPHALGGGVFARFAGNKVGLPNDIAALVVVARVLLGQVDVDIRLPIGLALGGKGVGLLGVIDLNLAGLLVVYSILDLLGKRAAIDRPTKVTAFDGTLLAIGARPPTSGAHGVKAIGEVCCPVADLGGVKCGVRGVGKTDPLQHRAAVDLAGIVAVELKGHVNAQEVVGGIACGLDLVVGECAVERLVGIVSELRKIDGLGQRRELDLRILNDMLAVELFVGAGLLDRELARLLVVGARCLKGTRAALVECVDGGTQILLELLLVKGVREHGQVDVLFQVDGTVFGRANVLAAERGNQARRPQQRLVAADNLVGSCLAVDDGLVGFG